jgi:hypothetical protein
LADVAERKLAAQALQRASAFAEDVIDTANVLFMQVDAAGIVRRVNAAAAGRTADRADGRRAARRRRLAIADSPLFGGL